MESAQPKLAPSLRAQRSNPESLRERILDCFVARAPRNDVERACATLRPRAPDAAQRHCVPQRVRDTREGASPLLHTGRATTRNDQTCWPPLMWISAPLT
ncbi:hypothetical protein C7G42_14930 [Bradyrhizobium sp. MOS003]|nr:hypothetical protein C7G42_14930 [Bradyrhizobium sp. MOS003]